MPPPGAAGASFLGASTTMASLVVNKLLTLAASDKAVLTTCTNRNYQLVLNLYEAWEGLQALIEHHRGAVTRGNVWPCKDSAQT